MHTWLKTLWGEYAFKKQHAFANRHWPEIFGLELGFIGEEIGLSLLEQSHIRHVFYMHTKQHIKEQKEKISHCVTRSEALPLQNKSVDCMFLYHALEASQNPHEMLREIERILVADGNIVIMGFNPFSIFNLTIPFHRRHFKNMRRFYHPQRVEDWLKLLGFECLTLESFLFVPALPFKKWYAWMGLFDRIGQLLFPYSGGMYMIRATKRTVPLTPVSPRAHKLKPKKIPQMVSSSSFDSKGTS